MTELEAWAEIAHYLESRLEWYEEKRWWSPADRYAYVELSKVWDKLRNIYWRELWDKEKE